MRRYENDCVGCQIGCIHCGREHALHLYCDKCHAETSDLFEYKGEELCDDCLWDTLPKYESDDDEQCPECGEWWPLFYLDGEPMCINCIEDRLRISTDED